jgi:hypothetical protein
MVTKLQQRAIERREGNPFGTYFAVAVMLLLLAMVGVYFFIDQAHEAAQSPIVSHASKLETAP